MTYLQGLDYGPRRGTLGLSYHMSEGGDGLALYLGRHGTETRAQWAARVRGVSCHAALLSTGERVQMLDWRSASGNLNPSDRGPATGWYNHQHLADVLGAHWPDPNTWTLSMEIAGRRAAGPTDKQVDAAISWGLDMRAMFPTLRGANGHHDQSPKGCPGTTAAMKAIFAGVGGHGLWTTAPLTPPDTSTGDTTMAPTWSPVAAVTGTITLKTAGNLIDVVTGDSTPVPKGYVRNVFARVTMTGPLYKGQAGYLATSNDRAVIVMGFLGTFKPATEAPADCAAKVAAAVAADRAKARVVWE